MHDDKRSDPEPAASDTVELSTIKLDLATVTLGEMVRLELESGTSFDRLLATRASRKAVGLYLHEQRTSAQPRSWSDLLRLRPRAGSS